MRPQINPTERVWREIEQWALHRLHDYRRALEKVGLDDRQTTYLRGKIAECHALINLGKPAQELMDEPGEDE